MLIRFVIFLAIWCVFDGIKPAGLAMGLVAAGLATWTSLRLQPRSPLRVRIFPLLSLGVHFIRSSIVAGIEVAVQAFRPRLRLRPGYVTWDCKIPASTRRDLFLSMVSLMPGSVPVAVESDGQVVMHCLDTEQPVAAQMADNEARLVRAIRDDRDA